MIHPKRSVDVDEGKDKHTYHTKVNLFFLNYSSLRISHKLYKNFIFMASFKITILIFP